MISFQIHSVSPHIISRRTRKCRTQGADGIQRACRGARLRLALGLGPHASRRRPEFPDPRFAHDVDSDCCANEQARVGTGILVLPLRNPVALAKQLSSMDLISGGRLIMGMASGWYKREFDAMGIPFKKRGKLMDENLEILNRLWSETWLTENTWRTIFRPR